MHCVVVCCSVLQCVVVRSVLQCVAVRCSVSRCVALCGMLQYVAVCCSVLQCVAVRCTVWCVTVCCSVLWCVTLSADDAVTSSAYKYVWACHVAVCCSVLHRVVVCCSVLQCVAVCCMYCSVLQCVAVCCSMPRMNESCHIWVRHACTHLWMRLATYEWVMSRVCCGVLQYIAQHIAACCPCEAAIIKHSPTFHQTSPTFD